MDEQLAFKNINDFVEQWDSKFNGTVVKYPKYGDTEIDIKRASHDAEIRGIIISHDFKTGKFMPFVLLMVKYKTKPGFINDPSWTRKYHKLEDVRNLSNVELKL